MSVALLTRKLQAVQAAGSDFMLALRKAAIVLLALLPAACDVGGEDQATTTPPKTPEAAQPASPPAPLPPQEPGTESRYADVYAITSVDLAILEKLPVALQIRARGATRTGGWAEIHLHPLQPTMVEPGVLGFTLVGLAPTGPATQALTPVEAVPFNLDPLPADAKRVTIFSETNEMTLEIKR